jgi:hypothetical protein
VEYDRIEAAESHLHPALGVFSCLPNSFAQTDILVPSLEPFIMILRQERNCRWMAVWAPLIHMHTGFTVNDIYESYLESSLERDEIEGESNEPERIPESMFEQRDIQHLIDAIELERSWIEDEMEDCLEDQRVGPTAK